MESGKRKENTLAAEYPPKSNLFPLSTLHFSLLHFSLLSLDLHLREPALVEGDTDIQAERILGDKVIR